MNMKNRNRRLLTNIENKIHTYNARSNIHILIGIDGGIKIPKREKLKLCIMYGLRILVGTLLMLIIMSFNIGVFIAIIIGHVIGKYIVVERMLSLNIFNTSLKY